MENIIEILSEELSLNFKEIEEEGNFGIKIILQNNLKNIYTHDYIC